MKLESCRRVIRRHQRGIVPPDPPTTRDLVIDIEWSTTGGPTPQTFLIHDSGRFSNQRIVMYATEEGLRLLARSGTWYMDGTFSTAPDCFRQLYVIRAEIGTTCVYAFLPGKTEAIYMEMLEAVIAKFTASTPIRLSLSRTSSVQRHLRSRSSSEVTPTSRDAPFI